MTCLLSWRRALWSAGDEAVAMTMLSLAVDKLLTMARSDEDRQVVMTILDSANEMLDDVKQPVLDAVDSHNVFISVIRDVFQQKVPLCCQHLTRTRIHTVFVLAAFFSGVTPENLCR